MDDLIVSDIWRWDNVIEFKIKACNSNIAFRQAIDMLEADFIKNIRKLKMFIDQNLTECEVEFYNYNDKCVVKCTQIDKSGHILLRLDMRVDEERCQLSMMTDTISLETFCINLLSGKTTVHLHGRRS